MPESAKVEILIDAFTQKAKEAIETVGDELVGLSADAEPAQSAMNEVANELDDATTSGAVAQGMFDEMSDETRELAMAMMLLQGRADEAGDEIAQAGAKSAVTSGLFSTLTVSTDGLAISFGTLSTVLTATLIPALIVLSTTLFPIAAVMGTIAAAAGGLAAGFGAVVGVPIAQNMKRVKQAFKEANREIVAILKPIADRFLPLVLDAIDALPTLVQNIVDAVGPLDAFAQGLRQLGSRAMEAIPMMVAGLIDLGTRALPKVIELMDWLIANGPGIFQEMLSTTREVGPALLGVADAAIELLPKLNDFGTIVLNTVAPALETLFDFLSSGTFVDAVRSMIDAMEAAAPHFADLAEAVEGMLPFLGEMAERVLPVLGAAIIALVDGLTLLIREFNSLPRIVKVGIFVALAGAVGVLSGGLLGLVAAIAAVAAAWPEIVRAGNWVKRQINVILSGIEKRWNRFTATVGRVIRGFVASVRTRFRQIVSAAKSFVAGVAATFRQGFNGLVKWMTTTLPKLVRDAMILVGIALLTLVTDVETAKDIVRSIPVVFAQLRDAVDKILQQAVEFAQPFVVFFTQTLPNKIDAAVKDVISFFTPFIVFFTETVPSKIDAAVQDIVDFFDPIITLITTTLPAMAVVGMAKFLGVVESIGASIHNAFAGIWNGVINLAVDALNALLQVVVSGLNDWLSSIQEVANTVEQVTGMDIADVGQLQVPEIQAQGFEAERRQANAQDIAERRAREIGISVGLQVQGDNPLANFIREQVRSEIRRNQRDNTRRRDRQSPQ